MPVRTIEFLENTAKSMPDRDIGRFGIVVCFVSYAGSFNYFRKHEGGSLTTLTREQAAAELLAAQENVK